MNRIKSIYIILIILLFSCEPDDICLESYDDTPKLILRFYDEITNELKPILNLQITSAQSQDTLFFNETDSIPVLLNHKENFSSLSFNINSSNSDNNNDNILINYSREPVFVSVGCGYILNFDINSFIIEKDQNNWIKNYNIHKSRIENEETRHVEIFH